MLNLTNTAITKAIIELKELAAEMTEKQYDRFINIIRLIKSRVNIDTTRDDILVALKLLRTNIIYKITA